LFSLTCASIYSLFIREEELGLNFISSKTYAFYASVNGFESASLFTDSSASPCLFTSFYEDVRLSSVVLEARSCF